MGHADLRIRERTLPAVADRAYELLRDRARLAEFVQKALTAHHAEAADRAALDLEDRDTPARLVVTRDGQPVTCLGAGMLTDAPVIPWMQTRAYLDAQALVLRARMAARRAGDEEGADSLSRVFRSPHRITRAEFDTLVVLAPLLVKILDNALNRMADAYTPLLVDRRWNLDDPRHRGLVEAAFLQARGCALLLVAARDEPLAANCALGAMAVEDVTLARLGWWIMASRPRRSMDLLRGLVDRTENRTVLGLFVRNLLALAVRYPWLHGDAWEMLSVLWPRAGITPLDRNDFRQACASDRADLRAHMLKAVACVEAAMRNAVPDVDVVLAAAERVADGETDDVAVAAAWVNPGVERLAQVWRPLAGMEAEPRWHTLPVERTTEEDRARADLWRWAFMHHARPVDASTDMLAMAYSVAPPEALVPDDRHRTTSTRRQHLQSFMFSEVELMRRRARLDRGLPFEKTPVRVEAKPGPNTPCPCGSGRKYKKCCGAA